MIDVTIYTDGACSGNPGAGGLGAILMYGEYVLKKSLAQKKKPTMNWQTTKLGIITKNYRRKY